MEIRATAGRSLRFGDFTFRPETGALYRKGEMVALEPQPVLVLARLVSAAGEVVTRDELAAAIWGASGTHVSESDGLNYCIRRIRVALDDNPRTPDFIATLPRRGYRFIAPVTRDTAVRRPSARLYIFYAAATAAVLTLIATVESRPNQHHQMALIALRAVHDLVF